MSFNADGALRLLPNSRRNNQKSSGDFLFVLKPKTRLGHITRDCVCCARRLLCFKLKIAGIDQRASKSDRKCGTSLLTTWNSFVRRSMTHYGHVQRWQVDIIIVGEHTAGPGTFETRWRVGRSTLSQSLERCHATRRMPCLPQ